jgi:putative ABC transport system permease protein
MNISESIDVSVTAIRSNKMRSALTLLGIIIGVTTIIAMQSLIKGLRSSVADQLSFWGANVFQVQKYPAIQMGGEERRKYRNRKDLTVNEADAIREYADATKSVGAEVWTHRMFRRGDEKTLPNVSVGGVTPEFAENNGYDISAGRFLTQADVDHNRAVAVIGVDVANKLFPYQDPIGHDIKVDGNRLEVIGLFESKGSVFGESQDNLVIIPVGTFQKFYGTERSAVITVQAKSAAHYEKALDQTIGILRAVRKVPPREDNDFEIVSSNTLIEAFDNLTKYVRIAAIAIASIALVVAGVGIMNIMLVSVTERTREIGIRKSTGAKRRDILWQFLVEAIILSEIGGIIGIIVGVSLAKVVSLISPVPAAVPVATVVFGLLFCSFVGIIFGVYPAMKAARMDPITALRFE